MKHRQHKSSQILNKLDNTKRDSSLSDSIKKSFDNSAFKETTVRAQESLELMEEVSSLKKSKSKKKKGKDLEPLFKNIERCNKLNKIFNMKETISKEFGDTVNHSQPLKMINQSNQSLVKTVTGEGSSPRKHKKQKVMDFEHF